MPVNFVFGTNKKTAYKDHQFLGDKRSIEKSRIRFKPALSVEKV
jgi:hypothetical protein